MLQRVRRNAAGLRQLVALRTFLPPLIHRATAVAGRCAHVRRNASRSRKNAGDARQGAAAADGAAAAASGAARSTAARARDVAQEDPMTLTASFSADELLVLNTKMLRRHKELRTYQMFTDGTLEDATRRERMLA